MRNTPIEETAKPIGSHNNKLEYERYRAEISKGNRKRKDRARLPARQYYFLFGFTIVRGHRLHPIGIVHPIHGF